MRRFYLPPEQCQGGSLVLTGSEAHHARHVLRLRLDERVTVLDGAGHDFRCKVDGFERDAVRLAVEEKLFHPHPPGRVTLLQAVPKGRLMEDVIQKATELGVFRIVPLLSERVVAHLDSREAAHKTAKWQLVAREAIKQCGSAWLPVVEAPVSLSELLGRNEGFELPLLASLGSGSRSPRDYFGAFNAKRGRMPQSVCAWVGPEGDFTPGETEAIRSSGALPITLGPLVLRTDTAAIYCLSVINYELHASAPAQTPASPP